MRNIFLKNYFKPNFVLAPIFFISLLCSSFNGFNISDQITLSDPEELLLFEIIPTVVSSGRTSQLLTEASSAISVLKKQSMKETGLTSLAEIISFESGIDFIELDRRRTFASIRGFGGNYSDRALLLLDGISFENPFTGVPLIEMLPVSLNNIDRVEIVKGPGSAVWGANALNGVINVILEKPKKKKKYLAYSNVTEFGDTYSVLDWSDFYQDWRWRTTLNYDRILSSSSALGSANYFLSEPLGLGIVDPSNKDARDYSKNWRGYFDLYKEIDSRTNFRAGIGHAFLNQGPYEILGLFPDVNEHNKSTFALAHFSKELDFDNKYQLKLAYRRHESRNQVGRGGDFSTQIFHFDGQFDFTPFESHEIVAGTTLKHNYYDIAVTPTANIQFVDNNKHETTLGIFALDRWSVAPHWTIESQLRLENYTPTDTDWSGRLTCLHSLDKENRQIGRISIARGYRNPFLQVRCLSIAGLPFMGTNLNVVNANKNLNNEHVKSLEIGYHNEISDNLHTEFDFFYQQHSNLINFTSNLVGMVSNSQPNNTGKTEFFGAEASCKYLYQYGYIKPWYNYHYLRGKESKMRAYLPAKHKTGINSKIIFGEKLSWIVNYHYASKTQLYSSTTYSLIQEDRHRLNSNIIYTINDNAFLQIGVINTFKKEQTDIFASGEFTAHKKPERRFFIALEYSL